MNKLKIFYRSFKEIEEMCPRVCAIVSICGVFDVLIPVFGIYFFYRITSHVQGGSYINKIIVEILIFVMVGLTLRLITNVLNKLKSFYLKIIYQEEHNKICEKLFTVDYKYIEDSDFSLLVNKYIENDWSPFLHLLWLLNSWVRGLLGFLVSLIMIFPLFKNIYELNTDDFFYSKTFVDIFVAILIISIIIIIVINYKVNNKCYEQYNNYLNINRIFSYYYNLLIDYKSGKEVRLYNEQKLIKEHATSKLIDEGRVIQKRIGFLKGVSSAAYATIGVFLLFFVYCIIGVKYYYGEFEANMLVYYIGAFSQVVGSSIIIAQTIGSVDGAIKKIVDYFYVKDIKIELKKNLEHSTFDELSLREVGFSYKNKNQMSIKNISLKISKGERIAIIGENGSGKTTLIKLLCGIYNEYVGDITVNGVNRKCLSFNDYNKLFSIVFQDSQLFSFPLYENIACNDSYDESRIKEILIYSDFYERLKRMKDGLKTYLFNDCNFDGVDLSSGEIQKVALARALYRNSPIIILDEPAAHMDPISERRVYETIDKALKDSTVIYISHRLSSCMFCDRVIVMDNGKIVQSGTHQELIKDTSGKYFELWTTQAQYYQ